MNLNADWHLKNKMPKNPTFTQRVNWHKEHLKNCQCRKAPVNILEAIKKS